MSTSENTPVSTSGNTLYGYLAAGGVTLIWASWLVVSRSGSKTTLTAYDMAALRYGVSALAALPVVLLLRRNSGLDRLA